MDGSWWAIKLQSLQSITIFKWMNVYLYIEYANSHCVFSPMFLTQTDCNSQRYRNWQSWNLHNRVLRSLSICRNLQQPKKNHGLQEIIMMMSDSPSKSRHQSRSDQNVQQINIWSTPIGKNRKSEIHINMGWEDFRNRP